MDKNLENKLRAAIKLLQRAQEDLTALLTPRPEPERADNKGPYWLCECSAVFQGWAVEANQPLICPTCHRMKTWPITETNYKDAVRARDINPAAVALEQLDQLKRGLES